MAKSSAKKAKKSSDKAEEEEGEAGVSFWTAASLLFVVRALAALVAPIMDCDETFNYLEPIHYVTRGSGMQTWEYAPQFALRSYAYVELYALPVRLAGLMGLDGRSTFFFLRICLAAVSSLCEAFFCHHFSRKFGAWMASITLLFMACSPGLYHASVATLPSTTTLYMVLLGFGSWAAGRWAVALVCGSFAVLLCMPPAALLWIPMGFAALLPRKFGLFKVVDVALVSLFTFVAVPSILDGIYYGKSTFWAMGNHLLYNVFSSGGDLYGTEPWTFYIKNLLLNFNLVAVLAAVSVPLLLLSCSLEDLRKPTAAATATTTTATASEGKSSMRLDRRASWSLLLVVLVPMAATFGVFSKLAHKEERFLTMLYPLLCVAAAISAGLVLDAFEGIFGGIVGRSFVGRVGKLLEVLLLLGVAAISASRIAALSLHFDAPLNVYSHFSRISAMDVPSDMGLCVGKEWYRFPGSFFLPKINGTGLVDGSCSAGSDSESCGTAAAPANDNQNARKVLPLLWLRSGFDGQLPGPFKEPYPVGLSAPRPEMNDRNKLVPSRYSEEWKCAFFADLRLPEDPPLENYWEPLFCQDFLDSDRSPFPWRSFWVPFVSYKKNSFAQYCIFRRRPDELGK